MTPVFHWGAQFANKFDLAPFKSVLDIGCRQGNITSYLGNRYPQQQFTAIDNVPSEIEKAKNHLSPNITFETQDALQQKPQNGSPISKISVPLILK
jgi:trans-aconitate methyltransferase